MAARLELVQETAQDLKFTTNFKIYLQVYTKKCLKFDKFYTCSFPQSYCMSLASGSWRLSWNPEAASASRRRRATSRRASKVFWKGKKRSVHDVKARPILPGLLSTALLRIQAWPPEKRRRYDYEFFYFQKSRQHVQAPDTYPPHKIGPI